MLQDKSKVKIVDNAGGKIGEVFKVLGGSKRRYARIGDLVVIAVKTAEPRKTVKKKGVHRAVVVRQTRPFRRSDGSYISFDENAVVIVDAKGEPLGTRVFGPIPQEIAKRGYQKIVSLAPEVL